MSRSLLSMLLAAAISSSAALGIGIAAEADDTPQAVTAPEPTALPLGTATPGLQARSVTAARDVDVAAAPAPEQTRSDVRGVGVLLAATGTSRDPIDDGGPVVTYSVEVEQDTGLDPDAVAELVEAALYDARSWARTHDLRRVAPTDASIHVVIATPDSADAICRRAGLRTMGWLSCWSGTTAAINLERWETGVSHVPDLAQYRRYVVNHEVGHGLGHGHRSCPGTGRTAPLMQQQTKSLQGCIANEWAYPDA